MRQHRSQEFLRASEAERAAQPKRPQRPASARQRSQIERDRQQTRQRFNRLLKKCALYGVTPREFYYWFELKQHAQDLHMAKGRGEVRHNFGLEAWLDQHVKDPEARDNLRMIHMRMGKVVGVFK